MLLGQNVNSYNDTSEVEELEPGKNWELSEGFSSMCKVKNMGLRFADLLDQLSLEYLRCGSGLPLRILRITQTSFYI